MLPTSNPCLGCLSNCCENLQGVKITEKEYQLLFAPYEDKLNITQEGRIKTLFPKAKACPLYDGSCTVYNDRPMECRLYPYSLVDIHDGINKVTLTLHARTGCPKADTLTPSRETAYHLIANFAKDAWPDKDYEIIFDEGLNRLRALAVKIAKKSSQIDMFK